VARCHRLRGVSDGCGALTPFALDLQADFR